MKRSTVVFLVAAALVGLLAGFLRWGLPAGRLNAELQDARAAAERLSQELADMRTREQQLAARLQTQETRLESTQRDLRAEKEMNSRLHLLVGKGQK